MSVRDQIKASRQPTTRPVSVPEWGQEKGLAVRCLTAREAVDFDAWQELLTVSKSEKGLAVMARLARLSLVYDGVQVFDEADEPWLAEQEVAVLQRVNALAADLNGMTAGARETIAKNSAGAGGSPTASPSPSENGTLMGSFSD